MTKLEKERIRLCGERVCTELGDAFGVDANMLTGEFDDYSAIEILANLFTMVSVGARFAKKKLEGIDVDGEELVAELYRTCEEFDDILNGRVCKPEKIRKGVEGS